MGEKDRAQEGSRQPAVSSRVDVMSMLINQSISDGGVCRTALAKPGLLKKGVTIIENM